jgi:hypothetical protein
MYNVEAQGEVLSDTTPEVRILVKNLGFPLQNERALLPNFFNFLQANSKRKFVQVLQNLDT